MRKKILSVLMPVVVAAGVLVLLSQMSDTEVMTLPVHDKIGLVINSPDHATTLKELDQIYFEASDAGFGRSNVYLFWNTIEPQKGKYDWEQSDILMSFNKKNDLKVTLFFSVINGETLGPFPDWIGKPSINAIGEDRLVDVLDAILSRYDIIDSVIIAGDTESQFRHNEQNISVYNELFSNSYAKLKEKHPDVKFGNSFGLHNVLNKDLAHIVDAVAMGDFTAFSYLPVDSLNDIVKTPASAKKDLAEIFQIVKKGKIALFEVSWSTSDFVGGENNSQREFVKNLFEFYSDNKSEIEFLTWYRQYDRPADTCSVQLQNVGDKSIVVGGGSSMGSSEHVIERLNNYVCNAGLLDVNGNPKPSWTEFKNQIELNP